MGTRAFYRIPVMIKVTLRSNNNVYMGTLVNISETGMLIRTDRMTSPGDSAVEVIIPLDNERIQVSGRLVRTGNIRDYSHGIGVMVLNPPQRYLDFLDRLLAVL
ncbi:MAG: PilZ domain-containing protein [Nitrospiraceae bacterium]|nr:MAG: PilZ domain-containing protein [Nitrospiraceae bacterium]